MNKDQLAVARGVGRARTSRSVTGPPAQSISGDLLDVHPLSILAMASSIRLEDPRLEQERVVQLGVAIAAGRDASNALDRWLRQSLTEYRGSRSAWDLEATTETLRVALGQFDATLRATANRLVEIIPELDDELPGLASAAGTVPRLRPLDDVAVAARLLTSVRSAGIDASSERAVQPDGR